MAEQPKRIISPTFRASFPALVEPRKMEGSVGEPKYSVVALWPKTCDLNPIKLLIREAAIAKWGKTPDGKPKMPANAKNPLRDGGEREESYPEFKDCIFATLSTTRRVGIVNADNPPIPIVADEVYAGCYCRASISAYAYDKAGNKGVALSLDALQKVRDGEAFGAGGVDAVSAFGGKPVTDAPASDDDFG